MPRPIVKSPSAAADKWERRAGSAGEEYRVGVETTSADWAVAAKAAEPSYKTAVAEAATRGAYGQGVDRAGNAKWKTRASMVGPARYSQGVGVAKPAYLTAIGPVLAAIGAVELPMRGPTGSESNYGRSAAIGKALRTFKTGRR